MSTTGKEYKLAIRIAGVVDKSFETALVGVNTQLGSLKTTVNTLDSSFTKLDSSLSGVMTVGKKAFSAIATAAEVAAAAVAAVTVASLSVGSEFESAFAGVKKTVDATEAEYEQLREDILEMSTEIPASAADIASVMEIAGQLGIATESLTDFTRTMIDLGESTNLEATEAADALARFANVTNMDNYGEDGVSNYSRLGSVIVELGNNFATTEEEIVSMATNLAATGDMVGLSQAQIMALATAMSATGIAAERGGSAMSKLLKKMQTAVETGSDMLDQFASVSDMTAEEFSETFETDAVSALSAFIEGLNDTERNGMSAISVLNEMGLNEVRLSDVILRLANAEGDLSEEAIEAAVAEGTFTSETVDASYSASLLGDALEMANEAWDENTALAVEAGKRYETFESQLTLLKNAFQDLGIAIYDEVTRAPALDFITNITDAINEFTETGLVEVLDDVNAALPTIERNVKKVWKTIKPVVNAVIDFGEWNLENPEAITGVIVGVGVALETYKIESKLTHIVKQMTEISSIPFASTILGIGAAIAVVTAALVAYEVAHQEAVNDGLAEHFGDITLSLQELEDVAAGIVSSDNLSGVQSALEAFDDLDSIETSIEDTVSDLNKLNWKVSIGLELTEDENQDYQDLIASYVDEVQEYALQTQYAVSLNIAATFEGTDLEGSNVVDEINQFYADKYSELEALGTELNETVTEAFNDGLLEIDEANKIAELQQQMAEIQEQLAAGEFEAGLSLIGIKYSGSELDSDTFQNLQEEISEQVETATEAYDEAYTKAVASIYAAYEDGDYLSEDDYQAALDTAKENYLNNIAELTSNAAEFQLNTIMDAYSSDLSSMVGNPFEGDLSWLEEQLSYTEEQLASMDYDPLETYFQDIMSEILNDTDFQLLQDQVEVLVEALEPTAEQLETIKQQYEEIGEAVPESITNGLEQYAYLQGIASGNEDSIYQLLLDNLQGTEYEEALEQIKEAGRYLPEGLSEGVSETVDSAVQDSYNQTQETIDEYYSQGFDVDSDVRVNLNTTVAGISSIVPSINADNNATGGIIYNKELSWLAEDGPESVIPHERTQRSIDLWEQTGKILGMDSVLDNYSIADAGSPTATIEYNPTLQFYGDAPSEQDLEDALTVSQDQFEQLMEQYVKKYGRVSFG